MKPSVYLETSFLSYVASLPNANPLVLDRIRWSQEWWQRYWEDFRLCISQSVVDECLRGNAEAAGRRTRLLTDLIVLPVTDEISKLAQQLVEKGIVPVKVIDDALHIACAAVHSCDFLLTWNFKHIHNPFQSRPFERQLKHMATDHLSSALPTASWDKEFFEDPIVAELDAYREQHAAQFDFDIDRIVADIQSREPQESKPPGGKLP